MAAVNKNKLLDNATKYIQKGQVDRAIKELQKVIEADPADVRTRLKLGDLFAKKNQNAEAAEQYNLVAESYSKDGFYLKAVAVYKQILKLDSSLIDVHLKLGDLYHQLGLLSDAMGQYQIVAQHYDSKGMAKESLATLRKMVELDPENIQSRKKLAEIIAREGQTVEAIAEFQKIAEDLKSKGRLDDLAGVLERVVHLDSTNLDTVRELAALYLDRGDPKRALAKLQICFRANPHDLGTLEMLSKAFVSLGQPEKAKSVYREIAKIHETAGNTQAKMEAYRQVLALDPGDSEARAVVEGRAPEPSIAYADPGVSVAPVPAAAPVRSATGAAPAPSGTMGAAAALADDPQTISKLLTEADVYLKYGLLEKALDHLRGIVRRNPENVGAHLKLKDVYLQHKDVEGAVSEIVSVIELCERTGDISGASDALQEGLRFAPGHAALESRAGSLGGAPAAAADPASALWNGAQEDAAADDGGVEISIDSDQPDVMIDAQLGGDVEISMDGGDDAQIEIPDDGGIDIQVDDAPDALSFDVDADVQIEPMHPAPADESIDVSVVDDIAIDAGGLDESALDARPNATHRGGDVVSLDAHRSEVSQRMQMPEMSAISPDQLLDELAGAFDAGESGEEIQIEDSSDLAISVDADSEIGGTIGDAEVEPLEVEPLDGEPMSFDDPSPARSSGHRSIEERFGATDEHQIPKNGVDADPMEDISIDASVDFASDSGITDLSVDLSGEEISAENIPDVALETDDAIAVDESPAPVRATASAPTPPVAAPPSAAAAVAAATALNSDPIPPGVADDVDEADFFVKQEIFDEAIAVYKRLLKKFPNNGGLLERMARAQALMNGEEPMTAAPVAAAKPAPVAAAKPAPVAAGKPAFAPPTVVAKAAPVPAPIVEAPVTPKPAPVVEPPRAVEQAIAKPVAVAAKPAPAPAPVVEETGGFDLAAELMAELDEIAEEDEENQPSFDPSEQVSVADVLREFRKGVDAQVGQEDKQARYDLGIAYREMGLWDEAIGEFQIASAAPERRADCFAMMGMCQRDKGELDAALESFKEAHKAAANDKQRAAFCYELAATLEAKGDAGSMAKAQAFYKQVQALDPGFRDVAAKLAGQGASPNKKISYV